MPIEQPNMRIALLGAPNAGKSSLFNALTGGRAKVANYPGVTVEYRSGEFNLPTGQGITLLDLPGVYGNCGHSMDEQVAIDLVQGQLEGEAPPDALLVVLDAARAKTHLHSALAAKAFGLPMIIVLNMMDLARRDEVEIDFEELSKRAGVPVVPCVAVRASGRDHLLQKLESWLPRVEAGEISPPEPPTEDLRVLQAEARRMAEGVIVEGQPSETTRKIDNILMHRFLGPLILLLIMFVMFQAVYSWSAPMIDGIDAGFGWLADLIKSRLPDGWLSSLLTDGIIVGVGSVLVFLPQILILFAFILALEASGYLSRAAFMLDKIMSRVGLNGRAFIPLLSSNACAIPGIMAARTIENERDRLTTIMVAPLMTCSARWPVYTMIIAAFFPDVTYLGFINLKGLTLFGLWFLGTLFALIVAFVLKQTVTKGPKPPLIMEMPSYKLPSLKDYLLGLWQRAMIFISRAGRIILPASVLIWFLVNFPNPNGKDSLPTEESFAGVIGNVLEPILAPIGFNLEIAIALIPGMAAREVVISALAQIYAVDGDAQAGMEALLASGAWSLPTALAFLAWFVFAPQCLSTLAITKRETNSWKWTGFQFGYLMVMAYVAAGATYWIARLFTG